MESFEKLEAWKTAKKLAIRCYEVTKSFPKEEQFSLTNQIRRAAISIVSNIAEGSSRTTSKDKAHFFQMAIGSLYELKTQFLVAEELKFIQKSDFCVINETIVRTLKLINGYKRYLNNKNL
jgi:four helix bundle protein